MSGVRRPADHSAEPVTMTLCRCLISSVLIFHLGLIPAASAQEADESYAWIETPSGKHFSLDRRRETTLLRAARLTEERGYTHFELMETPDAPFEGSVASEARKATDAYGNASHAVFPPFLTRSPFQRRGGVLVRFCNESVESCSGVRAHRVLLNLRP